MQNDPVTIYCPNSHCQAPNLESYKFCQKCRSLLPKRYLWAVGKGVEALRLGELLAGRYLLKHERVLLDTQPGLLPDPIAEIPEAIEPYLRLSPYQPQVPQVYGLVQQRVGRSSGEILLLEQVPIYPDGVGAGQGDRPSSPVAPALEPGQLMPELSSVWKQSTALRQLNWLWQIARFWQPFSSEGVASTLLIPNLVRVEGSLVRVLELHLDQKSVPTLVQLGQRWQPLSTTAQPELNAFLDQICQWMIQGRVRSAEEVLALLDRGLKICGQAQSRQIHLATLTDQGPSRQRNEDACYPPSGTAMTVSLNTASSQAATSPVPIAIVCDGIGGHEGGNVASGLAIEAVQQQISRLPVDLDPDMLTVQLEQSACVANDLISQRNDQEQRHERQRMGTTLVMALMHAHEIYLSHVGDSRAYRISRLGCHQVTLDDDVAAREVRLGYALYRDALQQPASGSLVQALGMGASEILHPSVQRFVLDEDCIFLLCSDGLSDHDRVEEYWEAELLPILNGSQTVAGASQRLVTIANTKNGHDNVTVGLIYCQVVETGTVSAPDLLAQLKIPLPTMATAALNSLAPGATVAITPTSTIKTQILQPRARVSPLRLLLSLFVLLGLTSVLAYLLAPIVAPWLNPLISFNSAPTTPSPAKPLPSPSSKLLLASGSLIQLSGSNAGSLPLTNPVLLNQPGEAHTQTASTQTPPGVKGTVILGSVVQVLGKLENPGQGDWLNLRVCSIPPTASPSPGRSPSSNNRPVANRAIASPSQSTPRPLHFLQPGSEGWILEKEVIPLVSQEPPLDSAQLGVCHP